MKLAIHLRGKEIALDLARTEPLCRFRVGAGPERQADIAQPEPGVYSVLLEGRSYEARVESGNGGFVVTIDGARFEVEVRDPRQYRGGNTLHASGGVAGVTAPIPGKIVRLLACEGTVVAQGQPILVIEAMKMQNELRAPKAGRVVSIPVREGDTVAAGTLLAAIE